MKYVWLSQTDAASALGISVNSFIGLKAKYKDNELTGRKKKYLIPYEELIEIKQQQYVDDIVEDEEFYFEQPKQATIVVDEADHELKHARLQKIIKETQYISQKIVAKKEELFVQWTERFFVIFEKSFTKFKNCLIDLHLGDVQLKKLNENLEYAIKNMEVALDEISKEYLEQEPNEE